MFLLRMKINSLIRQKVGVVLKCINNSTLSQSLTKITRLHVQRRASSSCEDPSQPKEPENNRKRKYTYQHFGDRMLITMLEFLLTSPYRLLIFTVSQQLDPHCYLKDTLSHCYYAQLEVKCFPPRN